MPSSAITTNASIAGLTIAGTGTHTGTGQVSVQTPSSGTLTAAWAGTLTTRTSDTAGTLTMTDADHEIDTGEIIDIYWADGSSYTATVGTVSGTSVPFTGASGDVLPIATTAITAMTQEEENISFDGDDIQHIEAMCTQRAILQFYVATSCELTVVLTARQSWRWEVDSSVTNPLAGHTITKIVWTQAEDEPTSTDKLQVGVLYSS